MKKTYISTLLAVMLASGNVQAAATEVPVLANYIQTVNPKVEKEKAEKIATSIVSESEKADLPVALVTAIVEAESTFKSNAVSKEGAVGLMQVHKKSHPDKNTNGIANNISSGISILKEKMEKTKTMKGALQKYSSNHRGYANKVYRLKDKYKKYKLEFVKLNEAKKAKV